MKKYLLLAVAVISALSSFAQNEKLFLFRNDRQFNSFDMSAVTDISYSGNESGFDMMHITTKSSQYTFPMSSVDSCVIRLTDIPSIYVNLTDYPSVNDLFKGDGFTKSTVYAATLRMDGNGMYDDLPLQTVEFRGRGNSTWNFAKTPYRFKMAKKASVCGLPKAKTFALIANYIDPSLMRNAVALWTARRLGLPFSNHCIPVNVYLNGFYKGAYMLTEKIGIGGGSVDISEETGMLFELDSNYDEDFRFVYRFAGNSGKSVPVMVKDPDLAEIKPDASERRDYFSQWQADFRAMADAVVHNMGQKLGDYVDLEDAARYVLVNSLACNRELNHPKSLYIYKRALGSGEKYHFGPVWDFDWAFGYSGTSTIGYNTALFSGDGDYSGGSFMRALVSNSDFREVYTKVWNEFYAEIYPELLRFIRAYACLIEPSARRNGILWPDAYAAGYAYAASSYDTARNLSVLESWIRDRVEWCDRHPNLGLY